MDLGTSDIPALQRICDALLGSVESTGHLTDEQLGRCQAGPSSEPYLVFPTSYCECQAFQFDVLSKQELLLCKHQLAAKLAKALGTLRCSLVDDLAIADLLLEPAPAG
ncbi:hypothetical protein QBZ16_004768 [Prototheca wickerhamii]|uniref:SWIM-type domain-containing protein n=1 Tax=Prototheca wickerhamii TaxID=3111 RepID=A0AAD9IEZ3_PROWI|nr:hypothetical protein QBZ16_004768 [Prototheca wickerhamii]